MSGGASPVAGLVTWQSPCSMRLTGQAAAVGHVKVYSQSSTALMNMGLEFCKQRTGAADSTGATCQRCRRHAHAHVQLLSGCGRGRADLAEQGRDVRPGHHCGSS